MEDGDELREITLDLELAKSRNSCVIENLNGERFRNYIETPEEIQELKIHFSSDSKKNKSSIWVQNNNSQDYNFGSEFGSLAILTFMSHL